jgi:hypothetical protein
MAFSQEPINYAAQYAKELANAYPYLSYFGEVWASPNNAKYRPALDNAKTVFIPSMSVSGAKAVNRDFINGQFSRNFNNGYEAKTMTMDREWDTIVDPLDINETNEVVTIANITKTFNEFQKIPEMDAYAASKLAGFADAFGGIDATSLTAANILDTWDNYLAYMTDQRVNRDRLIVHVTPGTYKLLKQAAGITRFLEVSNGIQAVDRNIAKLDGVTIVETPSDMMFDAYDFSEGWVKAAGAHQINMLFVDPLALIAPIVYDTSMLTPPSAVSKGKYVYYERYYYDVFNLMQRQAGFFANKSAPSLGALTVTSVAGSASGKTKISLAGQQIDSNGQPYFGLEVVYAVETAAVTLTYGAAPDTSVTWTAGVPDEITAASGKVITVAIVNKQTGYVIAGGNATVVAHA